MARHNNAMHAKPDLRVVLEWTIGRSGSVIADVIQLGEEMLRSICLFTLLMCVGCGNDPTPTKIQLRDLAQGLIKHESAKMFFPYSSVDDESYERVGTKLSWRVQILPFIGESQLYEEFKHDEPWDSTHNLALVNRMPKLFKCDHVNLPLGKTLFAMPMISKETFSSNPEFAPFFAPNSPTTFRNMKDGFSNTIMIVEVNPNRAATWTAPQDWEFDPDGSKAGLGEAWPDRILVALGDGSVHSLKKDIAESDVVSLMTRNGGEKNRFTKSMLLKD